MSIFNTPNKLQNIHLIGLQLNDKDLVELTWDFKHLQSIHSLDLSENDLSSKSK